MLEDGLKSSGCGMCPADYVQYCLPLALLFSLSVEKISASIEKSRFGMFLGYALSVGT